jgi:hypothetical protein
MKNKPQMRLLPIAAAVAMAVGATSCAALFNGGRMCRCTHPGPCVCCETGVVVSHQPVERDTAADDSLLTALLDLSKYELKRMLPEAPKPMVWLDDTIAETRDDLLTRVKTGNSRIMPRDVTMDNRENAIYFYYDENADGTVGPLRLRIQYYADDPLQYYEVVFLIDGFEYRFKPVNIERGKDKGRLIWEHSDDIVKPENKDLIYALSHCKWGEMTLLASNHINHRKELTEDQIKDFYHVLQLYRLAGGEIK